MFGRKKRTADMDEINGEEESMARDIALVMHGWDRGGGEERLKGLSSEAFWSEACSVQHRLLYERCARRIFQRQTPVSLTS